MLLDGIRVHTLGGHVSKSRSEGINERSRFTKIPALLTTIRIIILGVIDLTLAFIILNRILTTKGEGEDGVEYINKVTHTLGNLIINLIIQVIQVNGFIRGDGGHKIIKLRGAKSHVCLCGNFQNRVINEKFQVLTMNLCQLSPHLMAGVIKHVIVKDEINILSAVSEVPGNSQPHLVTGM